MPTMILHFPAGRYHATPWGHHVNEGLLEWPPSPWRMLRGLIACGYATLGWTEVPPDGKALVEALSGTLPVYRLPKASTAHSRHYMPLATLDKGREKTTLVFDAWVNIEGEIAITWEVTLADAPARLLKTLTENLGYLGRSESWVEARLAAPGDALPPGTDAFPHDGTTRPREPGWEEVPLFAPELPEAYAAWRNEALAEAKAALGAASDKKPSKKALAALEAAYPADLLACLQCDTAEIKAHGWSQPPGSRRVLYWRRADALSVGAPAPRHAARTEETVPLVLLSLATASRNMHALPPVTRTLPQAELLHDALVRKLCGGAKRDGLRGAELIGLVNSKPLEGHRHAHILPLDLDGDGHLDHVLIWSPMGLGQPAQDAIRAVRKTYAKGVADALQVSLIASGTEDDLLCPGSPFGESLAPVFGLREGCRHWSSLTPFVPPRFMKRHGANGIAGQIQAELASRGLPPAEVEVLPPDADAAINRLRHFVRARTHGGKAPSQDVGLAVRLVFAEPVRGPLCLGYASHFGLGLFKALPIRDVDVAAPRPS